MINYQGHQLLICAFHVVKSHKARIQSSYTHLYSQLLSVFIFALTALPFLVSFSLHWSVLSSFLEDWLYICTLASTPTGLFLFKFWILTCSLSSNDHSKISDFSFTVFVHNHRLINIYCTSPTINDSNNVSRLRRRLYRDSLINSKSDLSKAVCLVVVLRVIDPLLIMWVSYMGRSCLPPSGAGNCLVSRVGSQRTLTTLNYSCGNV